MCGASTKKRDSKRRVGEAMAHRDEAGVRGQILERQRVEDPEDEHREHADGAEPDPRAARGRTTRGAGRARSSGSRSTAIGCRSGTRCLDRFARGFGHMRRHDPGRAPYGARFGRPPVCGWFTGPRFLGRKLRAALDGPWATAWRTLRVERIATVGAGAVRKYAMSRAYLCVSIDTESDKGKGWRSRRPMSFEGITDGVVERLHPLFERFGAKPTYLLSPEVLRDAGVASRSSGSSRRRASSARISTANTPSRRPSSRTSRPAISSAITRPTSSVRSSRT